MAERRVQVPFQGKMVDGYETPVVKTEGTPTEITLEDGTVIRIQVTVASVTRLDSNAAGYDPEGNPWFFIRSQPVITILSVPAEYRRKLQ
jgi:hypothetical protein